MLVDNVNLLVKAGDGGDGAKTFIRNGQTAKGGPDGGNGGNGGSIYFQGTHNLNDLHEFRFKNKISAENGIPGKKNNLYGKNGEDLTILVPLGTRITETNSGRLIEIESEEPVLLAKGGKGGRGNREFRTAINQTPDYAERGTPGEKKNLLLELRMIAEIGLIGLPNAGKSSLLAVLTAAKPAIGAYPFTTLEPNLGVMDGHLIADIPGLIEGASTGKGLGIQFLKHIEKTKILVHCLDLSREKLKEDYEVVRHEFKEFNPKLLEKPEIVVLNKTDLVDKETVKKNLDLFKKMKKEVIPCSVYDQKNIEELENIINQTLSKI